MPAPTIRKSFRIKHVAIAVALALGGLALGSGALLLTQRAMGSVPENRLVIYAMHQRIEPGYTLEAVDRVLSGYGPLVRVSKARDGVVAWVPIGWYDGEYFETCHLHVLVEGSVVASVRIRSGDGVVFADAPADKERTQRHPE